MSQHQSIIAFALVCGLALVLAAQAAPVHENQDVQEGMKSAFAAGLSRFGNAVKSNDIVVPKPSARDSRVYSQYTRGLTALGGGKPQLREQYRQHNYVPLAPSVEAREFSVSENMTPEEAANIYKPSAPLQFTTDILRTP